MLISKFKIVKTYFARSNTHEGGHTLHVVRLETILKIQSPEIFVFRCMSHTCLRWQKVFTECLDAIDLV